jgi:hypothetical protein
MPESIGQYVGMSRQWLKPNFTCCAGASLVASSIRRKGELRFPLPARLCYDEDGRIALLHGLGGDRLLWEKMLKGRLFMANKHNTVRRHHIPKMKFIVCNWVLTSLALPDARAIFAGFPRREVLIHPSSPSQGANFTSRQLFHR